MKKEIKFNLKNENLFCVYSKERIKIGEEYIVFHEDYLGDIIKKVYKLEYMECYDEE